MAQRNVKELLRLGLYYGELKNQKVEEQNSEQDQRTTRAVFYISLGLAFAHLVFAPVHFLMGDLGGGFVTVLAGLFVVGNLLYLRIGSSLRFARHVPAFSFFVTITGQALFLGGIEQPGLPWITLTPLIALFTTGIQGAVIWMLMSILAVIGLYALDLLGFMFPNPQSVFDIRLHTTVANIGLVFFVTLFGAIDEYLKGRAYKVVFRMATEDMLTEIPNRRRFFQLAQEMFQKGGPLFAVLIDIDHFKSVNDRYGHVVGDEVLRAFSALIRSCLHNGEVFGRIGGEEFALILPGDDAHAALEQVEGLRRAVEELRTEFEGQEIIFTISCGISRRDSASTDLDHLLRQVDDALYEAKSQGRNRVCFRE